MDRAAYIDEIKLRLTGGILELELDDATLSKIVDAGLREIQRYICSTKLITIPYETCIDMKPYKVNSIARIYRTIGIGSDTSNSSASQDPMMISQWQLLSGSGNLYNFQNYVDNYASWNLLNQIRNTVSTDLSFRYDKSSELLYINSASNIPSEITIEYIPRYDTVEEITSDFWIDILMRLCIALTKVTVGRVRSRYTQSNALWQQDGSEILTEGNAELDLLRQQLRDASQLCYPID